MEARIVDLPLDPTTLTGLSEKLLRSHHANNYSGAVKRLNVIRGQLKDLAFAQAPGFQLNGLKREELIATNSMLLHELYFECLGGRGQAMPPSMELALSASFGSVERWHEEFVAMGKALGGGSGWVLLTFQPREGTMANCWAADHTHAVAGGVPILALDMYEHAYHMDFGAAAGQYVEAFMANINWARVHHRYQQAVYAASDALGASLDELAGVTLLDVRRAAAYQQAAEVIEGAEWRDPANVDQWSLSLPDGKPVVVYCVHGHEVSRAAALRLKAAGISARFLRGGIEAWKAAGRPLAAK
jgi:superoxide dismutase, Fe-Mn family